jgi:hypothetical protein
MKVQNKDNKGNPYHSDANGQFTSKDGGGTVNNDSEELGETGFIEKNLLSPGFKPRLPDDEYLDLLYELYDDEDEIQEEQSQQETQLKPINQMTQEELLIEIEQRIDNLSKKNISVSKTFFSDDLHLKCGALRQIDNVITKYNISNFLDGNYPISTYNKDGVSAAWAFAECKGKLTPNGIHVFSSRLRCNRAKMRNFTQVSNDIINAQKKGWWSEVDENFFAEATVCHEMGHVLTFHIINERLKKDGGMYYMLTGGANLFERETKKIKDEIFNIYQSQNHGLTYNDFLKDASMYGKKDNSEWFAETFMSMNGGKPTKTALAMKRWLDEEFGFNGGNK